MKKNYFRTYLNFQVVVATDAASVHLVVSIISIATRFILHKRKSIGPVGEIE